MLFIHDDTHIYYLDFHELNLHILVRILILDIYMTTYQ